MTIRVVLADDSALVREGVTLLLDTQPDLTVVGACGDAPSVLAMVAARRPDVVVTDIRMPPTGTDEGISVARQLRDDDPGVGVVVLSQHVQPEYATALFERGSDGRAYLLKERVGDVRELTDAIRTVHRGGTVVDPRVVEALMVVRRGSVLDRLTEREREVLREIAQGANNAGIAERLHLSAGAVEKHIGSIFAKLDLGEDDRIHRRVRAAKGAERQGHLAVGELETHALPAGRRRR